jgi:hypothetical protein
MLRAFSFALMLTFAGPTVAAVDASDHTVMAQQKPPPPAPKRDCEKNSEGIS